MIHTGQMMSLSLQAVAPLITVYMTALVSLAMVINIFWLYSLIIDITTSQAGIYIWEMGGNF